MKPLYFFGIVIIAWMLLYPYYSVEGFTSTTLVDGTTLFCLQGGKIVVRKGKDDLYLKVSLPTSPDQHTFTMGTDADRKSVV